MDQAQYSRLFSFLFNIANDVLVNSFEKTEYKKITLPFIVLRRLDLLLEDTKQDVIALCKSETFQSLSEEAKDQQLCQVSKRPFYNTSLFTLSNLRAETDRTRLNQNFIAYLDGYSSHVQDIINKFDFKHYADKLSAAGRLGLMIDKVTDTTINLGIEPVLDRETGEELLPALDNHTMGTLFEQLLRRFNEDYSVTEAGEHYTPRDYVRLLADVALRPVIKSLPNATYKVYDGANGTGGILSIFKERMEELAKENRKRLKADLYGQELQPETYAICKSDLILSEAVDSFYYRRVGDALRQRFANGSTISDDGHPGSTFDFCISNPPFGTPWKADLENWGISNTKDVNDPRFRGMIGDEEFSFVPNIGDPQMLFLANNVSRMKNDTEQGTRIVEIHNGSSLFTGNAGGGESNLRRYIIENDMLEAIIALPENMFYNTGIGTFIWVVTNRKEERRRGKVQLIDATSIKTPLRKNLGNKNCEVDEAGREAIVQFLLDFKENEQSKIFDNREFGYWQITVLQPNPADPKKPLKDTEQVPLLYPGGIDGFMKNEVLPYAPEAKVDPKKTVIGYELSFTKYFYKPVELRSREDIVADILEIEKNTDGLLNDILNL
ncbi:MAG: class I SAM-dependent DNA methyltransferase [Bacteroidia bacterium]|nr:class I SAM-dependent DNA methyltransferase [Bacteroidia bacterium]